MPTTLSPLRYPGGKTKFYHYVRAILEHNKLLGQTYVEPFAGGAGLAMKLLLKNDVKNIVINDIDPCIYAFWQSVLEDSKELCSLISKTAISMKEWKKQKDIYLRRDMSDTLRLGFSTFFLNRTNVSGVIKGGVIGGINQDGKCKMNARYNKESLIHKIKCISAVKERIFLFNRDARDLLASDMIQNFSRAFINFDPPYVRKGALLYENSFTEHDHRLLSSLIKKCRRKWMVTYDVCPLVAELYSKYRCSFLDVTYSVKSIRESQEYVFFSSNTKLPDDVSLYVP